jgi:hypothetical protein
MAAAAAVAGRQTHFLFMEQEAVQEAGKPPALYQ